MSGPHEPDARTAGARDLLLDVLATFREASDPREPAGRLWRAASPRFRSKLGGPDHLERLLGNPAWAPLLRHVVAQPTSLERIDRAARATVEVVAADGTTVRYLASLLQGGDADDDAWQLSGLVREELADV